MADNRYVSIGYVESGYDEVQNTAWYIESGYFELGYVIQGITQSGEAALSAASVVSATSARTKSGSVSATSTSTFTVQAVKVFGAGTSLTAVTTLTVIPLQIVAAELTAFNNISLTANAGKIHGAGTTINSLATVSATSLRIQPAAADFTAFNTVVVAAGRIRPAADFTALNATLTATAVKIFGAKTNTPAEYADNQFGEAGFRPQSGNNVGIGYLNYRAIVGDDNTLSGGYDGTTFSFYARADVGGTSGTIFDITSTFRAGVRIKLSGGAETGSATLSFDKPTGGGSFVWNLDALLNTPTYDFTVTRLHHYYIHIGAWNWPQANTSDRVVVVDAWVDGIHLGQQSYFTGNTDNSYYTIPDLLYVGSDSAGNNRWQGTIAQLWVSGYNSLASNYLQLLTPSTYETFGANGTKGGQLNNGFQPLPLYFIEGGRYNDGYPLEPGDFLTTNPLDTSYPIQGNFTVTAAGFAITYGEASLQSAANLSAFAGYLKQVNAVMSAEFSLTATPYDFVKASATMQSAFAFTADPDEISSGVNIVLAEVSVSADADVIRSGEVVTTLFADIAVTATTNLLGYVVITAEATLSATPYDFTKASTVITATAELTGEGRLQARTRGTVQMQSAFSLSAEVLKIRTNSLQIAAQASVVTGIGGALRGGNISMTAFDTVLSAGKIIEFLTENTITVTEEQRLLQVALESTVLLVEMANGVNTVTAESTDTKVAEEQGILLAQYNTPN